MNQKHEKMQTITGNDLEQRLIKARRSGLSSFSDIAHRLELVDVLEGVEYVNDSKATDVDASGYSLELMQSSVVWLVGQAELEQDYDLLADIVGEKVRAIICFGNDEEKKLNGLVKLVDKYLEVSNVEEAVLAASQWAQEGETVLFSPACSSFELFENYKERGLVFRDAVGSLK